MERKPEIQYIGQFYIHGSEARELARKEQRKRAKTMLPLERIQRIEKVFLDPVAIMGITVAIVMLVTMVIGAVSIHAAWIQYSQVSAYVETLSQENETLEQQYRSGFDPEDIREKAVTLGMIPMEEAESIDIHVVIPVAEPEPTLLEEIQWFVEGLIE